MRILQWYIFEYANGYFVEEIIGRKTRMFGPFIGARALEEFLAQRRTRGNR